MKTKDLLERFSSHASSPGSSTPPLLMDVSVKCQKRPLQRFQSTFRESTLLQLLPSLFLLSFLPPQAGAGNRFRMQLTLIYVFHLSNYFYYLNVFLMARFWMINESKWELLAQWCCTVSARSINPLAIWNTYMQLIRELQWKPSTMTQSLIKCSLLLLGLPHNMPWFSNIIQTQTDALWRFLFRQLKGITASVAELKACQCT